jgi:hypothetical protein
MTYIGYILSCDTAGNRIPFARPLCPFISPPAIPDDLKRDPMEAIAPSNDGHRSRQVVRMASVALGPVS